MKERKGSPRKKEKKKEREAKIEEGKKKTNDWKKAEFCFFPENFPSKF